MSKIDTEETLGNLRAILAGHSGFDQADVCIRQTRKLSIGAHQNHLHDLSEVTQTEVALRLQKAGATVVAKGSESEKEALKNLVLRGVDLLKSAKQSSGVPIVPIDPSADSMEEGEKPALEIPREEKIQRVLNLVSNTIRNPEAPLDEVYGKYLEVSTAERYWSLGSQKSLFLRKLRHELDIRALAQLHGREPFIRVTEEKSQYFDLDWSKTAKRAAQIAWALKGSKALPRGRYRCLLDQEVAHPFLHFLGQQLQGNRVAKGLSCFRKDEIGKPILSKNVTILDDARDFKRAGFRPFDAEGFPTNRNVFVRAGVLESFAVDSRAAKDLGVDRHGQATRDDLCLQPQPGFHNLTVEPGNLGAIDMERELGRGLRLVSVDSIDLVQPRTGTFLASFSGFLMEKGSVVHPVSRIIVQGDLQSIFSNIMGVGRDLSSVGHCATPALLIESLNVLGEGI